MLVRSIVRYFSNRSLAAEARKAREAVTRFEAAMDEKRRLLKEERQRLDDAYQRHVDELNEVLQEDQAFYAELYPLMADYLQKYLPRQRLWLERQHIKVQLRELYEERRMLHDWIAAIQEDMAQIQEAKEALTALARAEDHVALASVQNPDFPALTGTARDAGVLRAYQQSFPEDSVEYRSVGNLIKLLEERSAFVKELAHLTWAMGALEAMVRDLRGGIRRMNEHIRPLRERRGALTRELDDMDAELQAAGDRIRNLWDQPIDEINEQLEAVQAAIDEERATFERYRALVRQCHETERYDDLETYKSRRHAAWERLQDLYSERQNLREEREVWTTRRRLVLKQLKERRIYLSGTRAVNRPLVKGAVEVVDGEHKG